jgi:hypothetical protein
VKCYIWSMATYGAEIALSGGIVLEEAVDLSSDRLLMMMTTVLHVSVY